MTDSSFDDLVNRGAAAHQANQIEEALAAYKQALDMEPDDAEIMSLYGLALTHLGRLEEAGPALEKAVEKEPEQIGFRLNLVEYLEKSRQLERAEAEIDAAVSLDATMARAWEKKGDVSTLREQLNAAANAYATAASLDSQNFRLALKLAQTHMGLGNLENAHDALDAAEGLSPRDTDMFELRCSLLTKQRNWRGLEVASRLWSDGEPENPKPWYRQTQATFEQGRYRQSVEGYEKVLQLAPRSAKNLAAYGRICLYALELDKAATALDEAEVLDPNLTDMLAAKGLLLAYLGRLEEAETYCRRALDLDPEYAPAYTQLTRLTSGRLTDAEMQILSRLSNDENKLTEVGFLPDLRWRMVTMRPGTWTPHFRLTHRRIRCGAIRVCRRVSFTIRQGARHGPGALSNCFRSHRLPRYPRATRCRFSLLVCPVPVRHWSKACYPRTRGLPRAANESPCCRFSKGTWPLSPSTTTSRRLRPGCRSGRIIICRNFRRPRLLIT